MCGVQLACHWACRWITLPPGSSDFIARSSGEYLRRSFACSVEQWHRDGLPENPRAWIIGVARHKAIDRIRKQTRFNDRREELIRMAESDDASSESDSAGELRDERLRLIFTCCHPALADDARIAL